MHQRHMEQLERFHRQHVLEQTELQRAQRQEQAGLVAAHQAALNASQQHQMYGQYALLFTDINHTDIGQEFRFSAHATPTPTFPAKHGSFDVAQSQATSPWLQP